MKFIRKNIEILTLALATVFLSFMTYSAKRLATQNQHTIAEMRRQINNLEGAFKSLTRTEWTITDWKWSGTNSTDIVSIVSDGGGRGSTVLEVPVSHKLAEPFMLSMGRYTDPRIMVGKRLVFEKPNDSYTPEQNIVFGGLLVVSVK